MGDNYTERQAEPRCSLGMGEETGHQAAELGQPERPPPRGGGQSLTVRVFPGGRNADLRAVPAHNYPLPFLHF